MSNAKRVVTRKQWQGYRIAVDIGVIAPSVSFGVVFGRTVQNAWVGALIAFVVCFSLSILASRFFRKHFIVGEGGEE